MERNLKQNILETGVQILEQFGFGRLTQPQVSQQLGITQSRLTYYFPKREDLLIGVVEYATQKIASDIDKRLRAGKSTLTSEKLFALISWIIRDRKRTQLILNIFFESQDNPKLQERIKDLITDHQDLVATAIGTSAGDADSAIVMAAIWGLGIQHYVLKDRRTDVETEKIIKRLKHWIQIIKREQK